MTLLSVPLLLVIEFLRVHGIFWLSGDAGAIALSEAILTHPNLRKIVLDNNNLGPPAGFAFARVLEANPCLEELDLANNHIGEQVNIFEPFLLLTRTLFIRRYYPLLDRC